MQGCEPSALVIIQICDCLSFLSSTHPKRVTRRGFDGARYCKMRVSPFGRSVAVSLLLHLQGEPRMCVPLLYVRYQQRVQPHALHLYPPQGFT